jgi:oligoendopeptidase F
VNLADPIQVNKLFDELMQKPSGSVTDLEKWLDHESELLSALVEEQFVRYVRMTSQTDDPVREKAHLDFVEQIEPLVKRRRFELDKRFLDSPARKELPQTKYEVLDRLKENAVSLFREGNVELEKHEMKIRQTYEKMVGGLTVIYDGEERTMQQTAKYLESLDREVRQKAWLLMEDRRLRDRDSLSKIFEELLPIRRKIAENAGFDNYRDYMFLKLARFDYTPEDCFRFQEAVERYFVPLVRELNSERRENLGVEVLRPWDLSVVSDGLTPLAPFKTSQELIQKCTGIFDRLDPEFGAGFRKMNELNLLDLDSRKGKAPGGYNLELYEVRLPFIFMNAVGRDSDIQILTHESGHAFHVFETRNSNMPWQYRGENLPAEFAEFASQGMELIAGEHVEGAFYDSRDASRSIREHLVLLIRQLPQIAMGDAFQHWLYTHPDHYRTEREDYWVSLQERFGGGESYAGYEQYLQSRWQRILHFYLYPFYYIEYGISLLAAFGIWYRYRKEPQAAINAYRKALALGGSRPLPELFAAAELPFDFGPGTVEPYARELRNSIMRPKLLQAA